MPVFVVASPSLRSLDVWESRADLRPACPLSSESHVAPSAESLPPLPRSEEEEDPLALTAAATRRKAAAAASDAAACLAAVQLLPIWGWERERGGGSVAVMLWVVWPGCGRQEGRMGNGEQFLF